MARRTQPTLRSGGMRVASVLALLWTCLTLSTSTTHAQDATDPDAHYRELIHLALEEFRLHNWPEARVLFRQAHALAPSARTLRGLGMVSYEMRDYPQCIRELREALTSEVQPLTAAQRDEVEALLQRARAFVGRFRLEVNVDDARVRVDSASPSREPDGSVMLSLGPHWVQVEADGYQPLRREVDVEGGETGTLFFALQAVEPEPPAGMDAAPPARPATAAGPPSAEPPAAHVEPNARLRRTAWASLGSAAALGGTTLAVWLTGQRKLDDRIDACEGGGPCSGQTDDLERHSKLTNVGLALTAAATATGIVALALASRAERRLEVALLPGGLRLDGSF